MTEPQLQNVLTDYTETVFEYYLPQTDQTLFFAWDYGVNVFVRETIDGASIDQFTPESKGFLPVFVEVQKAIDLYCHTQRKRKQL